MKCFKLILASLALMAPASAAAEIHVWERQEIVLTADAVSANPYVDTEVWVWLEGPGFAGRVFGFWDGDRTFRVRITAPRPGRWTWRSAANRADPGLVGRTGQFDAVAWSAADLAQNPNRRGMIRATANGHALEYADGTPFFLVGDTWWTTPTFRFPWFDDDQERPLGPGAGFKDYVRWRRQQGYNSVAMIAAHPAWADDGRPAQLDVRPGLVLRAAWPHPTKTGATKDMHNEGGRPFHFPGKVPGYPDVFPDVDRINPAYFRFLDRKIDYLNAQGFVPFIEVARRDVSLAWKEYHDWPVSYARYIQYVFARYQAHICILSPIHFDTYSKSVLPEEFDEPIAYWMEHYGRPPFGSLLSANPATSTLVNFGPAARSPWLDLHQIGNEREHDSYWYVTQIFRETHPPHPALNGEPYYAGYFGGRLSAEERVAFQGSPADDRNCRSGMYGSVLSGGLAGHIYGANGIWSGDVEVGSNPFMWDAFRWTSGAQMSHLKTFILSEGRRYQDLVPDSGYVSPGRTRQAKGHEGWAYAAWTTDRTFALAYFESGFVTEASIRSARPNAEYRASWYDPRSGRWSPAGADGIVFASRIGEIRLPPLPSADDWALKLIATGRVLAHWRVPGVFK